MFCHAIFFFLFTILLFGDVSGFWFWNRTPNDAKIACGQSPVNVQKGKTNKMQIVKTDQGEEIKLVNVMSQQIVNGHDAKPHSWPWIASLRRPQKDHSWEHFCGGVLISPNSVLTAAHCLNEIKSNSDLKVRLGAHFRLPSKEDDKAVEFGVKRTKVHPSFDAHSSVSTADIAILVLDHKVDYNEVISPVCVANSGQLNVDSTCVITGWGHTQAFGELSYVLQQLELPVLSNSTCSAKVQNGLFEPHGQFCGGYLEGGRDSCQGDSGGPVVCKDNENDPWRLEGLVSYGTVCASKQKASVYTRVATYRDWIAKNME